VAIIRLAPQDYHRYHTHVAGSVLRQTEVEGPLYSVFADAIRAENGAIFNQRTVTILQHAATRKQTAFVAIGATCVGSVVMTVAPGETVAKGQEAGYFAFGGSTVVAVFPPDSVTFDSDLVERSNEAVETYLTMGSRIGRWK
jgi:phosphatidylserine decarboxylase